MADSDRVENLDVAPDLHYYEEIGCRPYLARTDARRVLTYPIKVRRRIRVGLIW